MRSYLPSKQSILILVLLSALSIALTLWRASATSSPAPELRVLSGGDRRAPAQEMVLKDLPAPKVFTSFTYRGEDDREVELTCAEKYAAVLIYSAAVDYRFDPLGAKFNTAYECARAGKMKEMIPLASAHLENGVEYYVIRAHQRETGLWHDPY